jgi:hypothetical protein
MKLGDCLSSVENVAEKGQSRLDEILTEAAWIQIKDFGGNHNWTLSIKQYQSIKQYLHHMGLINELICIACGMEDRF